MTLSFDSLFKEKESEVSAFSPHFYERICTLLAKRNVLPEEILLEEFDELSSKLDSTGIQEGCSVRNVLKARALALLLIRDDGEIAFDLIPSLIETFKKNLYSLAPGREADVARDEHILHVMELLLKEKELARLIKNMSRPFSNRLAEDIIRDTLLVPANTTIGDVHVRRACLAAWLTFLRQSLGSCFATAPSILIQQEQPQLFLRDLDEMMSTGRLKRTFEGTEYSVPVSVSWGNGDLKKPFLLHKDLQYSDVAIWESPGLIAAFDAVHLLQTASSMKEKAHELQKLLAASVSNLEKPGSLVLTDSEQVIEAVLLHHYGIKKQDVDEYTNRPKNMIYSGLMMHVPRTSKQTGSKGDPCVSFLHDFEIAKMAFKALADCALLKAWEFTVASFAEIKLEFARFNLYTSLGINHTDRGGIGECLYTIISNKVNAANEYLREREEEYEQVAQQMRYLDSKAKQASTEQEIQWIKVEYQSRQADLYHIEQQRQIAYDKAKKVAKLYEFLIDEYDKKFIDYFQEVYDPDLHDITAGPFDDSPAGFRLLYKHGRSNPSQWTRIYSL